MEILLKLWSQVWDSQSAVYVSTFAFKGTSSKNSDSIPETEIFLFCSL